MKNRFKVTVLGASGRMGSQIIRKVTQEIPDKKIIKSRA